VPAQHWRMAQETVHYLVLHRCDPSCNMARYYVLSIEPSLFGDATLIREWGRLGPTRTAEGRALRKPVVCCGGPRNLAPAKAAPRLSAAKCVGEEHSGTKLFSAQDLEKFFDSFSLFETASLVLAQHVSNLGSL
jgi:predicted DNA-binding WGR domain protein